MKTIIELDLSSIKDRAELHNYLFKVFKFPDYYGNNWDAFEECIREITPPHKINISGFSKIYEKIPREAKLLKVCLKEYIAKCNNIVKIQIS